MVGAEQTTELRIEDVLSDHSVRTDTVFQYLVHGV